MEAITERIRNSNLTPTERKAIEILTEDLEKTVFLSGTQMAEFCGVSAASMTRLIQKLGYEKLSHFKDELNAAYRRSITPHEMFQSYIGEEEASEGVKKSIINDLNSISKMEKGLNDEELDLIADTILKARKVYVVGMFASEIVVRALGHYLWRLGIEYSELMGVGLSKKIEYSDMQEGDVLIAISNQRVFKEVVHAVDSAKKCNLTTIAITDNYTNPLACNCDHVLVAPVKGVALDCTHVATLALVNVVVNRIAERDPELVKQNLKAEADKCSKKELFCI